MPGTILPPDLPMVLRDYERRIRQLEARANSTVSDPDQMGTLLKVGSFVGTSNSSHILTVTFTSAFPNSRVPIVVACPGDSALSLAEVTVIQPSVYSGGFQCYVANNAGTGIVSGTVRVNYAALG